MSGKFTYGYFFLQRIRAGHDASDVRQEITKQDAEIQKT